METKALLKEETLNKLSNLDLINHDEYETIHRQEIKTEDDCLKIDKFFLFKNSGIEQYNEIFLNEKRDTNDNNLINNTEYIKTLIENKDTIDNFKVYEKKQLYNDMQFIDNKDKQVIQFNKLNELLIFFNCDNYYNEISNDKLNKLILNNKSYIQNNFNLFQSILLETKEINYEIETKDELLIKNTISLLKKLEKYGIHCAYLNSGNIYYDGIKYKYNLKDNARASNKHSILYIVNNIKHLFNFNNFYFNYKYNNIKKVYIDDKIFIENGEKSNIEKKIIKLNKNKSVIENGKNVRPKMLIDTEEQLYYNKNNVYDNVNTKKDILNHLGSIKPIIKVVNGKKFDNFADLINKKVRAYNHNKDISIYNREPELKKSKEFYTNKKLPIINKYNYQAFNTDDKDNKIITFNLEKEIQYAIHIRPFIKFKKIYRHFYKDYYVLQTDYIDYINIGLYLDNIGINFDYDREYITENNLNDNIVENYEPNNNFTSNFIPIKIYRYKENNSLILYKNAITNEKIPSYDVLKHLQELKNEQMKIINNINVTNDNDNDNTNDNTNDNDIDNDNNDIDIDNDNNDIDNNDIDNDIDKKIKEIEKAKDINKGTIYRYLENLNWFINHPIKEFNKSFKTIDQLQDFVIKNKLMKTLDKDARKYIDDNDDNSSDDNDIDDNNDDNDIYKKIKEIKKKPITIAIKRFIYNICKETGEYCIYDKKNNEILHYNKYDNDWGYYDKTRKRRINIHTFTDKFIDEIIEIYNKKLEQLKNNNINDDIINKIYEMNNDNDNDIDNDNNDIDNNDIDNDEKYEIKVDKKIDNSFKYNLNNIIKIVDLLIDYKTNKDYNIIMEIKNIIEDKTDFIDYNNYYESFIISKRELFFEFSKKDIKLWSKLVYKLYD